MKYVVCKNPWFELCEILILFDKISLWMLQLNYVLVTKYILGIKNNKVINNPNTHQGINIHYWWDSNISCLWYS